MSVQHFMPTIWSKKIKDDLEEKCKLVKDCTSDYQGDIEYAKEVKILAVGDPTIGNYTGEQPINYEEMSDDSQMLSVDVQKYFAFRVNDVDSAQSMPGLPEKYQQKAMNKLAVNREKFVGALVAGKAQSTKDEEENNSVYKEGAINTVTATGNSPAEIKEAIDEAIVILREKFFEDNGIIEIDPRTHKRFVNELVEIKTANDDLIKRGVIGYYDGYDVKSTTNIYKDEDYNYCIVRSNKAIAFVSQINKVEAGRMEGYFSDYIRGLDTYGGKIISQDEIVCVKIPRA